MAAQPPWLLGRATLLTSRLLPLVNRKPNDRFAGSSHPCPESHQLLPNRSTLRRDRPSAGCTAPVDFDKLPKRRNPWRLHGPLFSNQASNMSLELAIRTT